ncbi:MAG: Uma2 family endonuclease [Spirochaetia bacterium]|jgi:Uma2 family endonuclease|nr:Uma2 family endonuclease [Spirochaetia bacterium]
MAAKQDARIHYTYADYLEFDDSVRCELINGDIYLLSPPVTSHRRILSRLFLKLGGFLGEKTGEIFTAPFALRLFPKQDLSDDTVLQPDIIVVLDSAKIKGRSCIAAPDMIVEILSPLTEHIDRTVKLKFYQEAGVREYWLADPAAKSVQVCILENNSYTVSRYGASDTVAVNTLPGCAIDMESIFDN